jgi:hypothetical protein
VRAPLLELEAFGGDDQRRVAIEHGGGAVVQPQASAPVRVGRDALVQRHPTQPLHALATDRHARVHRLQIGQGGHHAALRLVRRTPDQHEPERDDEQQRDDRQRSRAAQPAIPACFSHLAPPASQA